MKLAQFLRPKFVLFLGLLIATGCQLSPVSPPAPSSAGHLAYIGADGNVYVTTADLTDKIAVTQDATAPREGSGLSYQRIAWSPTGQLAYASVTRSTGDQAKSTLYVAESASAVPQIVGRSDSHFVIYIYWSPTLCPVQPDCRQLAYLIEEEEDIGLHLVSMTEDQVDNQIIGYGWPFYYSWSTDGQSILWHTGGSIEENESAQLVEYSIVDRTVKTHAHHPAAFLAPAWSPAQPSVWLGAIAGSQGNYLEILDQNQATAITPISAGGATFVWSPDGSQIAYALRQSENDRYYDQIFLYDIQTSESRSLTKDVFQIQAFFWDPAGTRLAYLTRIAMPDTDWLQWRVYDIQSGDDRGFKAFNPSLQMRFVMASFNQYAQSHRFWSPDGRYLVFGERQEILRQERVGLIDTWADDTDNVIIVDQGTMGFWSY